MTHEQRIAEYQAAYMEANDRPVRIRYAAGYYYIRSSAGHETAHRAAHIDAFSQELRRRAAERNPT